jgi:hypothetical protein
VDAQKAIDLDKGYVKGYYRLGAAKLALGKHKEALAYFRQVCILFVCLLVGWLVGWLVGLFVCCVHKHKIHDILFYL